MTLEEAKQILNLTDEDFLGSKIKEGKLQKNYDHLFSVNVGSGCDIIFDGAAVDSLLDAEGQCESVPWNSDCPGGKVSFVFPLIIFLSNFPF